MRDEDGCPRIFRVATSASHTATFSTFTSNMTRLDTIVALARSRNEIVRDAHEDA